MPTTSVSDHRATIARVQRDLAAEIDGLPRLSVVLERFLERAQNDCATIATITADLESDPAITGWILRQARSGFYAQSRPIGDVGEACVVLGLETVSRLAYAACSRNLLLHDPAPYVGTDRGAWLQGLAVSSGAARLARLLGDRSPVRPAAIRVAGLIHDLGKQLVAARWPTVDRGPVRDRAHEIATVGFDHATASAALAAHWSLDQDLVLAIATHHEAQPLGGGLLIAAADLLTAHWRVGVATYPQLDGDSPLAALLARLAPLTEDRDLITRWAEELAPIVAGFDEMLRWSQRPEPPELAEEKTPAASRADARKRSTRSRRPTRLSRRPERRRRR